MILEEWEKAERALAIFAEEDEDRGLEYSRRIEEIESELLEMRRVLRDLLTRLRGSGSSLFGGAGL
jgi:hypothetical protein